MFHPSIPQPYQSAWNMLRRESHHYGRQFAREGIHVRMVYHEPLPDRDPSTWPEMATVHETYIRLQIPEILDRVCGIIHPREIQQIENEFRGYNMRHQRQLCQEYRQALDVMELDAGWSRLRLFLHDGIRVTDPHFRPMTREGVPERQHPDYGIVRVSPIEVFTAMRICHVPIPVRLAEFWTECRCVDAMSIPPTGPTGPVWDGEYRSPWDGTVAIDRAEGPDRPAFTVTDLQAIHDRMNANLADAMRAAPQPSMLVTGAYNPRMFENHWSAFGAEFYPPSELDTPERQAAYERRRLADLEVYRHRAIENEQARARALALVERVVTAEEFQSLKNHNYIELTGTKYRYRIKQAGQTALYGLRSGAVEYNACLQLTDDSAPAEDRVVMEYLMIRNEEERYLTEANLFPTGDGAQWAVHGNTFGGLGAIAAGFAAGIRERQEEERLRQYRALAARQSVVSFDRLRRYGGPYNLTGI